VPGVELTIKNFFIDLNNIIIPTIQAEESYKVDIITIFEKDLAHIKVNSLCEYKRLHILEKALIGNEPHTLKFIINNNGSLSEIEFSIKGDICAREFSLRNH
jgi:hypothetical protein